MRAARVDRSPVDRQGSFRDLALPAIAIMVAALAVRLLGIASRPIWYDEAFSILFAEKGPAAMFAATFASPSAQASEVHPLGYYLLLWQWMRLFGETLVSVRTLSVLAGVATVGVLIALARAMSGNVTALAAGAVAALAPFQIHYSQEIRMYAFMALWLILATYCFWQGSHTRRWKWWIGFAGFCALAESTQYLSIFYLLAVAAWPLLRREWRAFRSLILAASLSIVLCLPWLIYLPQQLERISRSYWLGRPGAAKLLTLVMTYVANLPLPGWELPAGLFAALGVAALAVVHTVREVRRSGQSAEPAVFTLYLAIVPAALMWAFSQWVPVFVERALLPSGVMFCAWIAWSLARPDVARIVTILNLGLLLLGFSMGLYEHVTYGGFPYAPFDRVAADLARNIRPGDVIVHSSKLSVLPTLYFDRSLPGDFISDPAGTPIDTLSGAAQRELGVRSVPSVQSAAEGADRVWYILFDESNKEYTEAGYPRHPDLTWLMQNLQPGVVSHWGELSAYLFTKGQ